MKLCQISLFALILALACSGGSVQSARLVDSAGDPLVGYLVNFSVINDQGEVNHVIASQVTDADGNVRFDDFTGDLSGSLIFEALLPSGSQRAFAAGEAVHPDTNANPATTFAQIDAVSEAVVTAIIYITETVGGRSLADFSIDELRILAGLARERIENNFGLDINDSTAVVEAVIADIGKEIANSAGGELSALPLSEIVADDTISAGPGFAPDPGCSKDVALNTAEFFIFDIKEDGATCNMAAISGPMANAFDGSMSLALTGDGFSGDGDFPGDLGLNPAAPFPTVSTEDGRELRFGPVTSDAGLEVTRKVLVYNNQDVVRYLEVLHNPTAGNITVDVNINGEVGFVLQNTLFAQNHPTLFDETSDFGAVITAVPNDNPPRPSISFIIDGAGAADGVDSATFPPQSGNIVTYTWQSVVVPAGATKVFVHYVYISASQSEAIVRPVVEDIYWNPDMSGFSAEEINGLQNFLPNIGNVIGEAGTVASNAQVTISSSATVSTVTVPAARDGSFKAAIDAVSGSIITIDASDGTSKVVTVQ